MTKATNFRVSGLAVAASLCAAAGAVQADQLFLDDVIVDGSMCVGVDCSNGESFGFDTIRLKENNLRIKFQDTSTSASFPSRDWQITANDPNNGGANKFSIDDIDGGLTPFTLEAGAPSNSLYVDDGGRVGLGTATPVVELHIPNGDSPTVRLEQDGTSGFTPQVWDIAGNETNFFVRDVTNGSRLPFKIRPAAPTNSLFIDADGDVGLGTASPAADLHVAGDGGVLVRAANELTKVTVEDTGTTQGLQTLIELINLGDPAIVFSNTANGNVWTQRAGGRMIFDNATNAGFEFDLHNSGNLTIAGTLTQSSDKQRKMAIEPVDAAEILQKVASLPVSSWTYIHDADTGIRHIGPMAQDFYAAFGTGADETGISSLDGNGVALAAIQALALENAALVARIEALEAAAVAAKD